MLQIEFAGLRLCAVSQNQSILIPVDHPRKKSQICESLKSDFGARIKRKPLLLIFC